MTAPSHVNSHVLPLGQAERERGRERLGVKHTQEEKVKEKKKETGGERQVKEEERREEKRREEKSNQSCVSHL